MNPEQLPKRSFQGFDSFSHHRRLWGSIHAWNCASYATYSNGWAHMGCWWRPWLDPPLGIGNPDRDFSEFVTFKRTQGHNHCQSSHIFSSTICVWSALLGFTFLFWTWRSSSSSLGNVYLRANFVASCFYGQTDGGLRLSLNYPLSSFWSFSHAKSECCRSAQAYLDTRENLRTWPNPSQTGRWLKVLVTNYGSPSCDWDDVKQGTGNWLKTQVTSAVSSPENWWNWLKDNDNAQNKKKELP